MPIRFVWIATVLLGLVLSGFAISPAAAANPQITSLVDGIDNGEEGPQLIIERFDIDIKQHGSVAEVRFEVELLNPSDEEVEGRFSLQLPRDAVVTGYALDIEGRVIVAAIADLVFQQVEQPSFRGVIRTGGVAEGGTDAPVFLGNQGCVVQVLLVTVTPVAAGDGVQMFRERFRQSVGHGVEEFAELGHLIEPPGEIAVDPVRCADHAEENSRPADLVDDYEPDEQRDEEEPKNRNEVGDVQGVPHGLTPPSPRGTEPGPAPPLRS